MSNIKITRDNTKAIGHLATVAILIEHDGHRSVEYSASRFLTNTTREHRTGILTPSTEEWDCDFYRGDNAQVTVTLPPLHKSQTNSEWFAALDSRITIVQQAFNDLLPGEYNETYTKEYPV